MSACRVAGILGSRVYRLSSSPLGARTGDLAIPRALGKKETLFFVKNECVKTLTGSSLMLIVPRIPSKLVSVGAVRIKSSEL